MKECPKCGELLDTPTVRRQIGVTLDPTLIGLLDEYKVSVSQVLAAWHASAWPKPEPYKYARSSVNVQVVCTVSEDVYEHVKTLSGGIPPSAFCRGIIFDYTALTSLM